jgi:K+-sensing histidine kinase KdpD
MVKLGRESLGRVTRVKQSLRPCSRLVSDVVHQVAQPLTVMQGLLEDALPPGRTTAQYKSLLETLRREVDRLSYTVRRISEMAEIESAFEQEMAVPLLHFVKRTIEQMAPGVEPKELKIHIHAPREVRVRAGPRRLEWGLQKLISGALGRSPKCGKLLISISSTSVAAILRISDQGPDVFSRRLNSRPDALPRCFASAYNSEGDSLDWALAEWMFKSSGANLVVRNRAKHGCVATVTLPLARNSDESGLNQKQRRVTREQWRSRTRPETVTSVRWRPGTSRRGCAW